MGWTIGSPAFVLKEIAAKTGIFAISLIAHYSLYSESLMSFSEFKNPERAPTTLHIILIGWASYWKPL